MNLAWTGLIALGLTCGWLLAGRLPVAPSARPFRALVCLGAALVAPAVQAWIVLGTQGAVAFLAAVGVAGALCHATLASLARRRPGALS